MTRSLRSIGKNQSLETAHEMMRALGIRHLPVLDAGRVVGIVSQRDLYLIETMRDVDPRATQVEDAMSQDIYQVTADAPLRDVARAMMEHKYGSAIVMDGQRPIGIFTTIDALAALVALIH